ncbi:2-oxo acid dehydrogenase acyltransferase [Capnocytophaga sp. oral taxon 863 str. F0517]|uniref:2-oxo acid dehydrogenase subunit E2 n=1 Tax=Capnocytophaga sp. oral taxon 863 TaxID=1227265 RepID=UPI0003979758|nr:2-oxo acid dehydrogenase acyltransferase [Capnocytophaga sp. oral taxon 863 str. F0517]
MARYELKLPQMGESVEEATVSSWLKKVGDTIKVDDILVEVATDKVDSEIPSEVSGVITEILTPERTVVKVGQLMAIIETDQQQLQPVTPPTIAVEPTPVAIPEPQETIAAQVPYVPQPVAVSLEQTPQAAQEEPFYSPLVRTIAKEENISKEELATIEGSGADGRLTKHDLLRYLERRTTPAVAQTIPTTNIEAQATPTTNTEVQPAPITNIEQQATSTTQEEQLTPIADLEAQIADPSQIENKLGGSPFVEDIAHEALPAAPTPAALPAASKPVALPAASTPAALPQATTPAALPEAATPAALPEAPASVTVTPPTAVEEPISAPALSPVELLLQQKQAAQKASEEIVTPTVAAETPAPIVVEETPTPIVVEETPAPIIVEEKPAPIVLEEKPAPIVVEKKPAPIVLEEKPAPVVAATTYTPSPVDDNVEVIEMTRMGKLIANYMIESKHVSAHATSFIEVDVTRIWNWRNKHKKAFESREGEKLTFTPIFIEAVAKALRDFPLMNISTDGERIFKKKNINIGMATALPNGDLIVPVIKNADQLSLVGLAKNVNDLAKRARENKLKPDEVKGGTYTVTNIGAFGNLFGTPILNQPQVGILAIGAIQKVPAVVETPEGDVIAIRYKLMLSHSFDHRVVNGALGGMFVQRVAKYLEQWDPNREV